MIVEPEQNETQDTEVDDSLDSTLRAAMSAAEESDAETQEQQGSTEPAEVAPPPPPAESSTKPRDEAGRFAKTPKGREPAKTEPVAPAAQAQAMAPAAAPAPAVKAPQSWTPTAREKWGALPPDIQAEVAKREKEVARALQESAEARKTAEAYSRAVAPYEGQIRAEGVEPLAAVQSLLQTAQALRTAPPAHKAAIVAGIVQGHGIDPNLVLQHLQSKAPASQPYADPNAIAADVEKRVRAQLEREQVARAQAEHQAMVEKFAADHEFFDDVRPLMATIVSADEAQGLQPDLERAYSMACQLHPGVKSALEQREASAAQAKAQQQLRVSTQRARAATLSLPRSGSAGKAPQAPQADTVDDALRYAMEQHSQ